MHPEDFLTLEEWHRLLAAAPTPRDAALLWLMVVGFVRYLDADQTAAVLQAECLGDLPGNAHAVMIASRVVLDRDLPSKVHQLKHHF
jgi:hypothetical protein